MQIDEERSLRSVGKEGDCRRKTTVTIRHQRVCDKHDSKCPNPNPRLRLPSLRVIQLLNLHLLQRKDSWMESVLTIQFPAVFPDPPPQSDEQATKKAKTETEHVAHGSVCSIFFFYVSYAYLMFYRREKARSVSPKFL